MALATYSAENDSIPQLSTYQLELVKKCIDILSPIEEITRSISARLASISIVILLGHCVACYYYVACPVRAAGVN